MQRIAFISPRYCQTWPNHLYSIKWIYRHVQCTVVSWSTRTWGQTLSKNVSKTLSYWRRSFFISPLCFFRFFFTKRQYPSKGQSTLWQMRLFFHIIFWCFLSQYNATLQLAQWKRQTHVWLAARKCNNWACIRPSVHPGIARDDGRPVVCHHWNRRAKHR